jgi:hypothetical protein
MLKQEQEERRTLSQTDRFDRAERHDQAAFTFRHDFTPRYYASRKGPAVSTQFRCLEQIRASVCPLVNTSLRLSPIRGRPNQE